MILDWFARHSVEGHPLSFATNATWFSEALLPSAFLARYRGDKLAENWTHADGVVGHFLIGEEGKADLKLLPEARQFLVLEAKIFSGLSSGVSNARYYDQAARNVACMAEVLRRAGRHPSEITNLGFIVLAPASQIERGIFHKVVQNKSIFEKVRRRAQAYAGAQDQWFKEWFRPTWQQINVDCLSWEELIAVTAEYDLPTSDSLRSFFDHCIKFNR